MRDDSNNLMKDVKEIKTAGNTTTAITNSNGIYVAGENSYAQLLQGNTNTQNPKHGKCFYSSITIYNNIAYHADQHNNTI